MEQSILILCTIFFCLFALLIRSANKQKKELSEWQARLSKKEKEIKAEKEGAGKVIAKQKKRTSRGTEKKFGANARISSITDY